ncbi:RagB/SusD family nutrient uptake outer membrane protein [uncultured Parabacteroides sp.]|uniref:RagB/SusD family nutrient uptake outer membrane protein n=1 Tax=uncultured Parabacteroides sp. TaxID=512312 RepID=UPI0026117AA6|nr:RagB/SusD family nutrient uptake outer membrane protein [uncultured Parabacteroides sp.]
MKNIVASIKIGVLTGCMALSSSCSDFLDKQPPASTAGVALESEQGVEAILIGAYADLDGIDRFGGALGADWVFGSCASDEAYKGSEPGDNMAMNAVEQYSVLPDNECITERWRSCYDGVSRANQVLQFLHGAQSGSFPLKQERARQVEGEAKFLRAWYHFQANKVFKNIPYIKAQYEVDFDPVNTPNKDAGWDEIEMDLQWAIDNLPEFFPNEPGRATKYAAMVTKAHAHLFQGEYGEAKVLLDQIINSGRFRLVDNFFDNFDERTENNEESIFEFQASSSGSSAITLGMQGPCMHQKGPASGRWGFFQPSQSLVDAFQVTSEGLPYLEIADRPTLKSDMGISSTEDYTPSDQAVDLRLDWTVSRRGIDFLGWGIHPGADWIRSQSFAGPYMTKKYMHFEATKDQQLWNGFNNNRNYRIYRYSHVILWRAECAVVDGDLEKARELVNMIRNRVKTSTPVMGRCLSTNFAEDSELVVDWEQPAANYKTEPYPVGHVAFSSQEQAWKAVRTEIQLEFATEGHRFFDLRRWNIDSEVLNDFIARDSKFRDFMQGVSYSINRRYWPLPQTQIDIQQGVLSQDPDYM